MVLDGTGQFWMVSEVSGCVWTVLGLLEEGLGWQASPKGAGLV